MHGMDLARAWNGVAGFKAYIVSFKVWVVGMVLEQMRKDERPKKSESQEIEKG